MLPKNATIKNVIVSDRKSFIASSLDEQTNSHIMQVIYNQVKKRD